MLDGPDPHFLMQKRKNSIDNGLAADTKKLKIADHMEQTLPCSFTISTMSNATLQEKAFVENHYRAINSTLAMLNRKRNQKD
jgi:hypothetical protein